MGSTLQGCYAIRNACQTLTAQEGMSVPMQTRQWGKLLLLYARAENFHPVTSPSCSCVLTGTFRVVLGPSVKFVGCYDSKGSLKDLHQSGLPFKTWNFRAKNMAMEEFKDFELMLN